MVYAQIDAFRPLLTSLEGIQGRILRGGGALETTAPGTLKGRKKWKRKGKGKKERKKKEKR